MELNRNHLSCLSSFNFLFNNKKASRKKKSGKVDTILLTLQWVGSAQYFVCQLSPPGVTLSARKCSVGDHHLEAAWPPLGDTSSCHPASSRQLSSRPWHQRTTTGSGRCCSADNRPASTDPHCTDRDPPKSVRKGVCMLKKKSILNRHCFTHGFVQVTLVLGIVPRIVHILGLYT